MEALAIPYFDNASVSLFDETDWTSEGAKTALSAFLTLTPADRLADAPHVYAYYKDYHEIVGGEDWLDQKMGVPQSATDIWQHVTPVIIFARQGRDGDENWYIGLEAKCAWEEEHGLMMVWRHGTQLCKVSGYDDELTNADAYGNGDLADIVYNPTNPKFTTRSNT